MFHQIPDQRPLTFVQVTDFANKVHWAVKTERKPNTAALEEFNRIFINSWNYREDQLHQLLGIACAQNESTELMDWIKNEILNPTPIKFVLQRRNEKDVWGWETELPIEGHEYVATLRHDLTEHSFTKPQLEEIRQRAITQGESIRVLIHLDAAISRAGDTLVPFPAYPA